MAEAGSVDLRSPGERRRRQRCPRPPRPPPRPPLLPRGASSRASSPRSSSSSSSSQWGPPTVWSGRVVMAAALAARAAGGGGSGTGGTGGGTAAALLFEAAIVGSASTAASSPWPQPSASAAGDLVVLRLLDLAAALGAAQRALALAPRGRLSLRRPPACSPAAAGPGSALGAALLGWLAGAGGRARVAALAALPPHALLIVCAADGGGGGGGGEGATAPPAASPGRRSSFWSRTWRRGCSAAEAGRGLRRERGNEAEKRRKGLESKKSFCPPCNANAVKLYHRPFYFRCFICTRLCAHEGEIERAGERERESREAPRRVAKKKKVDEVEREKNHFFLRKKSGKKKGGGLALFPLVLCLFVFEIRNV